MGPVEKILRAAGELLRDESKRCRYAFALNARGVVTGSRSPDAVKWCVAGAITKHSDGYGMAAAGRVLECSSIALGHAFTTTLNDNEPELIDDLFSEAIEAAAALSL